MANCLLKYPFNFRLHSIHTRTWWRIKRLEDGMGKHRMTRCYGGYKYGMRATYFHNEYSAYNCLNFPGKRSTKTKIKNINKCVIFESILKTFRTRSFKTKNNCFWVNEQLLAGRYIYMWHNFFFHSLAAVDVVVSFSRRNNFITIFPKSE